MIKTIPVCGIAIEVPLEIEKALLSEGLSFYLARARCTKEKKIMRLDRSLFKGDNRADFS